MSGVALAGSLFMIFFHRDPDRLPQGMGMVSPADGRIVQAKEDKIAIFMGAADVHVNRAPMDGVILRTEYRKGSHLPAFLGRACNNQQNRIWLETIDGEVELRQITGTIVREIICYVCPGDHVVRGERVGMIRFGSRVEVTIPKNYVLQVNLGDKVRAGETVVAVRHP
jgi:phosphatidylserine decarboxylase